MNVTSYFSFHYLVLLLPFTILCYLIMPEKIRRWVLLVSSYGFFFAISGKLIVYLLFSTIAAYGIGILLASQRDKKIKKKIIWAGAALHLGILLVLKYTAFFAVNINQLFEALNVSLRVAVPSFALPIGISFYTLQAVSYLLDVYHEKIAADRNLLRLALYMSFFPQIMEGPICRYQDTAAELWSVRPITYKNLTFGIQRILYGMMKKIVVADRLNLFIENIFDKSNQYDGFVLALGAVGYTIQLYMDFSGTMDLVIGSAQIFGVNMPENFKQPFISLSISEFWKRWHITLGTWFRDYLFYPLSMSKPLKRLTSKARKRIGKHVGPMLVGGISLLAVWFCNGLWHGVGWNYIFFGLYHFVLIFSESLLEPWFIKLAEKLKYSRKSKPYRFLQIAKTSVLVCIGELFFRADSLAAGFAMLGGIFGSFSFDTLRDGSLFTLGMDRKDYLIIFITVLIVSFVGIYREKGIDLREKIAEKNVFIRYAFYYALIMFIVIFGAYGMGYIPVDPMYAEF